MNDFHLGLGSPNSTASIFYDPIEAYSTVFAAIHYAFTDDKGNSLWDEQTKGVNSGNFRMEVAQYIVDGYILIYFTHS
jgi:hypothetical protein